MRTGKTKRPISLHINNSIIRKIENILYINEIHHRRRTLAQINTTVIAFILASTTAYLVFIFNIDNKLQQETIKEAEKINDINYVISMHFAGNYIDNIPENIKDTVSLADRMTLFLSVKRDYFWEVNNMPTDPLLRGLEALELMNIITHNYPFPKKIGRIGKSWVMHTIAPPVCFKNFASVEEWLIDLERVLGKFDLIYRIGTPDELPKCLQSVLEKDRQLIENRKNEYRLSIPFEIDPRIIYDDFIINTIKVSKIARSTNRKVAKVKTYRQWHPPKYIILIGILMLLTTVIFGVIIPVYSNSQNKQVDFAQKWIPLVLYSIFFSAILIWVFFEFPGRFVFL